MGPGWWWLLAGAVAGGAIAGEANRPVEIRQGGYVERVDPNVDYKSRLKSFPPRSPQEVLKTFHLVPGFRLELAAAEPQVCSPVDAVFDAEGRLFVAEMIPYAENNSAVFGSPRGRVVMLEDLDGDGRFERSTVFCDNLVWPTGLACFDGGLFVAAAPDLWYVKDTDGDGRADVREKVVTGFLNNNPAAVPNSLRWGLDCRLHGMPSMGGGDLKPLRWERLQGRPQKAVSVRGRDFSLNPRTGQVRAESGGAQHGMAFDDWGAKFESANSSPIIMIMYEERYLERNPAMAPPPARLPIWTYGATIYRTSPPEPWRVLRMEMRIKGVFSGPVEGGGSPVGYFTGACGLMMPRPGAWPVDSRGDGFLGEGSSNLVHRMRLRPNGVPYAADRVEAKADFLTSEDTWFRPVQFCGGPDGNLYVVDMYRQCYEHPDAVPPSAKKHMDLSAGWDRGHIYRVVPEGFHPAKAEPLTRRSTAELVSLLAHPNAWHRQTASRLLYERQDRSAVAPLARLAAESAEPLGRMHALYALSGQGALSSDVVLPRLSDAHPRVRENAVRLAEKVLADSPAVRAKLCSMDRDADIRVRYQLAFTLGEISTPEAAAALARIAGRDPSDRWIQVAVFSSCFGRAGDLLARLAADHTWRAGAEGRALLERLAEQVGLQDRAAQVDVVLKVLDDVGESERPLVQSLVRGLARGLAKVGSPLREKIVANPRVARVLAEIVAQARSVAAQEKGGLASRIEAVGMLGLAPYGEVRDAWPDLLSSRQPQQLQMAALETLGRFSDPEVGRTITAAWPAFSPTVRSEAAEVLFARRQWLPALLESLDKKVIQPSQIDAARIQTLLAHRDPQIRRKAETLLASEKLGRRKDVVAAYRDVLKLKGEAIRGKDVFKRNCATCHRLEEVGYELGLPLTTMQTKGPEFILVNLLDPNLQVLPEYINYVCVTTDGRSVTGMIVSETASNVTLRRAEGQTDVVLRSNIDELQSTGLSIMPEGLEKQLTRQEMADVIAYLISVK